MGIVYPVPHIPMLGKGSVLLDIFDSNKQPTGLQHLGNVTKAELDIKDDIAELYQSLNQNVTLIASAVKKRQLKLTITGTDFSASHIGIAQMSPGPTPLVIPAVAVVGEVLASATATKKGRFFFTATPNIDPAVPVTLKSNATALVLNTDFIVADYASGAIYIPAGSAAIEADTLVVGYTPKAATLQQVAGATVPFQNGHIRFVGDPVDGQKLMADFWNVNLSPNGQLGLISEDYGNWTLDGNVLDDAANHPEAPFVEYTFF